MTENIQIVSIGSATPVGWNAGITYGSFVTNISRFTLVKPDPDSMADPIKVSRADYLHPDCPVLERMETLLYSAIRECFDNIPEKLTHINKLSVYIGLPSERPGLEGEFDRKLQHGVEKLIINYFYTFYTREPDIIECHCIPGDNIAGLVAIRKGVTSLLSEESDICLVAAVDSFIHKDTLKWLKQNDRIRHETNKYGFVPGEAAACMLLSSKEFSQTLKLEPLGEIKGIAQRLETNLPENGKPCLGDQMADAVEQCFNFDPSFQQQVDHVYIDMDGTRARSAEYGFATRILGSRIKDPSGFKTTITTMGNIGAAYGLVLANLSLKIGEKGYASGPNSIIITANDTGERVVCLIKTKNEKSRFR